MLARRVQEVPMIETVPVRDVHRFDEDRLVLPEQHVEGFRDS
jgi:hypothetical protein